MTMPWFRLYSEILNDPKLHRASKMTKQPYATILGAWTVLLALASHSPKRGYLCFSDDLWWHYDEIKEKTGLDQETFDSIMGAFADLKLIATATGDDWAICNWDKRQFRSDNSTERVQRFRERKAEAPEQLQEQPTEVSETLPQCSGNALDTDPETKSESDTDKRSCGEPPQPPPKIPEPVPKPEKPNNSPMTDGLRYFLAAFGRKRFATIVQKRALADCEQRVGTTVFREVVDWAARNDIRKTDAIITAAKKWGKKKVGRRPGQLGQFTDAELEKARRDSLAEEPIDAKAFLEEG